MDDMEKLRALLPHWLEHNQEHADQYEVWADKAAAAGHEAAAGEIRRSIHLMQQADEALKAALAELGGAIEIEHHHHHHSHE